ncbi:Vacuolar protein-sorting-associated protein 24 [Coemansia thaxteri]|nr:Vacuolar protein-sorting-associated protein 24 [Coemansia thaxteri]KAJ2472658.1 Vacuolar protein-sorting-associated protein 24 [Coemansia sp. RSA 2322]
MFNIFAKQPTPDEMVRKWRSGIRGQERELDRQLRGIQTEEAKVKRSIKLLAKKNDAASCKSLAKELVRSRKQKDRIFTSKAQLNSIVLELQRQVALLKVAGSLQKSTQVMRSVNQLMRVPQLQATLMEMSKEMMKAGIIEEMTEEMFDSLEDEDLEDEAEEEVQKVLAEVTEGTLGNVVPMSAPKEAAQHEEPTRESESEAELDLDDMRARLSALRS